MAIAHFLDSLGQKDILRFKGAVWETDSPIPLSNFKQSFLGPSFNHPFLLLLQIRNMLDASHGKARQEGEVEASSSR